MAYATAVPMRQIIARLRAQGFTVIEVAGWDSRGHGPMGAIQGVVCHHTAGSKVGDYPSLAVVRDGRADLAGPLAHWGIGRTGTIYVIAAGVAWHAGAVNEQRFANAHAYGIEAENTGTGEVWSDALLAAYVALCAAICRVHGLKADAVRGHKEVCVPVGRKIDPAGIAMSDFRSRIVAGLSAVDLKTAGSAVTTMDGDDDMTPEQARMLTEVHKELTQRLASRVPGDDGRTTDTLLGWALNADRGATDAARTSHAVLDRVTRLEAALSALAASKSGLSADEATRVIQEAIAKAVVSVDVNVHNKEN